jgi:hypothetical protein
MQQRQLRLGDILDDYCTRERRVTNHAVVAMVGDTVKQTRCTTCDTEHEYKHARVPRQRRKLDSPAALYAQVAAGAPKRVTAPQGAPSNETVPAGAREDDLDADDTRMTGDQGILIQDQPANGQESRTARPVDDEPEEQIVAGAAGEHEGADDERKDDEGPVHRPLIRASLPREGQPPTVRPIPEFTIRQPGGRQNRFRPRGQRGAPFQTDRSTGNGPGGGGQGGPRSAGPRHGGGRPPQGVMASRRHGPGRKRSK